MMKKLFITMGLVAIVPFTSFAQESVGFSETDNIQPLLDYRLPAWGFSNFFLDFSLSGDFERDDQSSLGNSVDNQFYLKLEPIYTRFRESEPRVSTYRFEPEFEYGFTGQKEPDGPNTNRNATRFGIGWQINEKFYLDHSDLFITGITSGHFRQNNVWLSSTLNGLENDDSTLNRSLSSTVSIGVGYGRLRNVNPVIRSLRLNERMQALGTGQQMPAGDILLAAEHFTALPGYFQTYDRPDKYFWGDLDQIISSDLSVLNAFDLLYLMDVQRESLGWRQEGWQVQATAGIQHTVNYFDNENTSSLSRSTLFIPRASGIWSKNISLKHQLSLSGNLRYLRALDDDSSISADATNFTSTAGWLYTVTDRFLVTTSATYLRTWRQDFPSGNLFSVSSDFSYFLENRIALFADAGFTYTSASFSSRNLQFNAGVRYYLRRQLF